MASTSIPPRITKSNDDSDPDGDDDKSLAVSLGSFLASSQRRAIASMPHPNNQPLTHRQRIAASNLIKPSCPDPRLDSCLRDIPPNIHTRATANGDLPGTCTSKPIDASRTWIKNPLFNAQLSTAASASKETKDAAQSKETNTTAWSKGDEHLSKKQEMSRKNKVKKKAWLNRLEVDWEKMAAEQEFLVRKAKEKYGRGSKALDDAQVKKEK
ncbi:MAG: hypothetical protein Q9220_006070 [cf. Caloplaca sp. 1 TL-2023]